MIKRFKCIYLLVIVLSAATYFSLQPSTVFARLAGIVDPPLEVTEITLNAELDGDNEEDYRCSVSNWSTEASGLRVGSKKRIIWGDNEDGVGWQSCAASWIESPHKQGKYTLFWGSNSALGSVVYTDLSESGGDIFYCGSRPQGDPSTSSSCERLEQSTNSDGETVITQPTPTPTPEEDTNEEALGPDPQSCEVNMNSPLSWVLCPVMNGIGWALDVFREHIEASLGYSAKTLENNEGLHKSWGAFRNVANILFVIAFLAIIISQAITGRF